MDAGFLPAVSIAVQRSLNLVVARRIPCRAAERMTSRTEWPAEEATTKRIAKFEFRNSKSHNS